MSPSPLAELKVLSAGAIQRGLASLANAFQAETSHKIIITFATAPVLRSKVENEGASTDIVIVPVPAMRDFEKNGFVISGSSAVIGSVKAGVVVREGAPAPNISTAEALKNEILASQSLVYNEGSSGLYVEKLLERLGVAEEAKAKTTRLPNADAVMKYLASSKTPKEIGFGQIPAILLYTGQGVKLVGPLPKEIENITTYAAGVSTGAKEPEMAEKFIRFLITPSAREAFNITGVE